MSFAHRFLPPIVTTADVPVPRLDLVPGEDKIDVNVGSPQSATSSNTKSPPPPTTSTTWRRLSYPFSIRSDDPRDPAAGHFQPATRRALQILRPTPNTLPPAMVESVPFRPFAPLPTIHDCIPIVTTNVPTPRLHNVPPEDNINVTSPHSATSSHAIPPTASTTRSHRLKTMLWKKDDNSSPPKFAGSKYIRLPRNWNNLTSKPNKVKPDLQDGEKVQEGRGVQGVPNDQEPEGGNVAKEVRKIEVREWGQAAPHTRPGRPTEPERLFDWNKPTSKHNNEAKPETQDSEKVQKGRRVQGVPSDQGPKRDKLAKEVRKTAEVEEERPPIYGLPEHAHSESSISSRGSAWSSASSATTTTFKAVGRYARKRFDLISWHRKLADYEQLFPHGKETEGIEDAYHSLCECARCVAVVVKAERYR